jgi:hypothetical protein
MSAGDKSAVLFAVGYPHAPIVVSQVAREFARDLFSRCAVLVVSIFGFYSSLKADHSFGLPFCVLGPIPLQALETISQSHHFRRR